MRSAIIAAAFAVTAIAVPYQKRDVVTNTNVEMVYVTDIVTVTAVNNAAPTKDAAPTKQDNSHWGHKPWWNKGGKKHTTAPSPTETTVAPTTSSAVQAPTSSSPAPEPTKKSAPAAAPTDYASKCTLHHNIHRANHSAPDIEWSQDLVNSAQVVADSCSYAHNVDANGGGYGQNIAAGVEADNITAIITNLFYNGEVGWYSGLYGEAQPDMTNFEHWGHFSQIVWKGTTHVGCYTKDCTAQGLANVGSDVSPYFTVCNYKSPGNFANEYGANVGRPLGHPTADWNYGL